MAQPMFHRITDLLTDGTTASVSTPVGDLGTYLDDVGLRTFDACIPYMREVPDNGIAGRIAGYFWNGGAGVDAGSRVDPPAKAPTLSVRQYDLSVHSIFHGGRGAFGAMPGSGDVGIPSFSLGWVTVESQAGTGVGSFVHNLGGAPDVYVACLSAVPTNAVNWALTSVDGTSLDFKNWHATEDAYLFVMAGRLHAIANAADFLAGPFDMALAGLGEVSQAHGLGETPHTVWATPYSAGGAVEPTGAPIMTSVPDATNVYFGASDAAAAMTLRTFPWLHHAIQL